MLLHKPRSVLKSITNISILACSTLILSGCVNQQATNASHAIKNETVAMLTTQVTYLDRSMLRPGSQLTVTLADVSKMDVAADIISQQTIDIAGAPPYTVTLPYDASILNERSRYSVSARIVNQDNLLYVSTTHNNPFSHSQQSEPLTITVSKVAAQQPDVSLVNTYFKAITLNSKPVTVETREPFIQFSKNNKSHGFLGCNNFTGSYQVNQQSLTFGPQASTKMMCFKSMEQESAMSAVLENTALWDINGESLILKDLQGKQLATFKAMYFN
ncbi:META domain-containing protein [Pseudoalteromonas porphyrae]|uniref:DUF306 domain-containing protein n=1 Tax=Pseudoalteromonas porphyrae TaxID=187330 RepID=A0A0N0M1G9_9GAMM|nr:META domain-containing protein [Pseudoalteromonas porphyrae]KPH65198.1 hypothetical protein ADS77_02710 [Pseudoalteromonas porphyrae]